MKKELVSVLTELQRMQFDAINVKNLRFDVKSSIDAIYVSIITYVDGECVHESIEFYEHTDIPVLDWKLDYVKKILNFIVNYELKNNSEK